MKTILSLFIIATLISCHKKEDTYDVTFTMYSKVVPYTFVYSANNVDYSEQVTQSSYTKHVTCYEYDFEKQMGVIKDNTINPDSLYIKASFNGMSTELSTSVSCPCTAQVMIQLNQAK